jgi:predicted RNA polymerase sigma factor
MALDQRRPAPVVKNVRAIGVSMRHWIYIGAVVFSVLLVACSADKPKELLEIAEFEERQMNLPHAKQLYEDVIRLYPNSKEAATARTRLAALKQAP